MDDWCNMLIVRFLEVKNKSCKYIFGIGCVLLAGLVQAGEMSSDKDSASPSQKIICKNDFMQPSGLWSKALKQGGGQATLTCSTPGMYLGNVALLEQSLPMPQANQTLDLSLKISGMTDASGGKLNGSARIFLAPEPLPKFAEPYIMPNVLWLYLKYEDGLPKTLSLWRKANEKQMGTLLYQAKLDQRDFPLQLKLNLGKETYRLKFNNELSSSQGSRSGRHGLDSQKWNGKLRFGMRVVNENDRAKTRLHLERADFCLVTYEKTAAAKKFGTEHMQRTEKPLKPVSCRVHPEFGWRVNGIDQIPRIFGVTVNGASRGGAVELVKALNLNSARAFLWPFYHWKQAPKDFIKGPVSPGSVQQYGHKGGVSDIEMKRQLKLFFAQDLNTLMEKWWGDAKNSGQAQQAALLKRWGLTSGLVFHPGELPDDGLVVDHPEGVNRFFNAYLNMLRKNNPELNLDFVQLSNEPNYPHFAWPFKSQREAATAWLKIFNRLDTYMHKQGVATHLLGPCLASGEFFSWGGWQDWTKPVLKDTKYPVHYFNYHCYDTPAYTNLAWQEMLQAQADAIGRPRPRAVITEMNFSLFEKDRDKMRVRWWAEQLFTALQNPDKAYIYNYFLLAYGPMEITNLLALKDGKWTPNDTYWLYWTMAKLRGRLIYVSPVMDSRLKLAASSPAPEELVIAIFNDASGSRKCTITLPVLAAEKVDAVSYRYVCYDKKNDQIKHGETDASMTAGRLEANLAAGEVRVYNIKLATAVKNVSVLAQEEIFSPTVAQKFTSDLRTAVKVKRLPHGDETAWLRFALTSDDLLSASSVKLVFNGRAERVYLDQAPAQVENEQRNTWWVELPLNIRELKYDNSIVFADPDAKYRLMFASIIYRQHPGETMARDAYKQARSYYNNQVQAGLKPIGMMMSGDQRQFHLAVSNPDSAARDYKVSVKLPPELCFIKPPSTWLFQVPPNGQHVLSAELQAQPVTQQHEAILQAKVSTPGLSPLQLDETFTVYPRRLIRMVKFPPVIDGKLNEWSELPFVVLEQPGLKIRTWLAADAKYLYMCMDVAGSFSPVPPVSVSNFWQGDCIELFLDLYNTKSRQYSQGAMQLFFCPVGVKGAKAFGGRVIRERRGDNVEATGIVADDKLRTVSKISNNGYCLEAAIPWAQIDPAFRPKSGLRLGLNLTLNHPDAKGSPKFENSILGLRSKCFESPEKWPIVILK